MKALAAELREGDVNMSLGGLSVDMIKFKPSCLGLLVEPEK